MKSIQRNNERQLITFCCFALLILSIVTYMYFVCLSVVQVVARKDTLRDLTELRSDIAFLESSYIEANYAITQKVALNNNFSTVKNKIFIKQSLDQGLVLRTTNE